MKKMRLFQYELTNGDKIFGRIRSAGLRHAETPRQLINDVLKEWPFEGSGIRYSEVFGVVEEILPAVSRGEAQTEIRWEKYE